jgi:heptosyltransferase II
VTEIVRVNDSISMQRPQKILVRGVNWLGDAVMTMPALTRLKEAHPDAQITLLTREHLAGLWHSHPAVDEFLTIAAGESPWAAARRLRPEHYDVALIFPNSLRSALEVFLARIPARIGYRTGWRNWLLTRPIPPRAEAVRMRKRSVAEIRKLIAAGGSSRVSAPPQAHHLFQYLRLVQELGAAADLLPPRIYIEETERQSVLDRFHLGERDGALVLGLNPGAEYGPAKRWPPERFVETAVRVQSQWDCRWLVFGGQTDAELAGEIAAQIERRVPPAQGSWRARNLAGKTTLRELCALLKSCRVLLTNDTGPMHIAAAVGTPVVVPFGSTSPFLTAPGLPGDSRHRVLTAPAPCAPCFLRECPVDFRCMRGIEVEQAARAIFALLINQQTTEGITS